MTTESSRARKLRTSLEMIHVLLEKIAMLVLLLVLAATQLLWLQLLITVEYLLLEKLWRSMRPSWLS